VKEGPENDWRQQVLVDDETRLGNNFESSSVSVLDQSGAQQQEKRIEDRGSNSELGTVQQRENKSNSDVSGSENC